MVHAPGLVAWHVHPLFVHQGGAERAPVIVRQIDAATHKLKPGRLFVKVGVVKVEAVDASLARVCDADGFWAAAVAS